MSAAGSTFKIESRETRKGQNAPWEDGSNALSSIDDIGNRFSTIAEAEQMIKGIQDGGLGNGVEYRVVPVQDLKIELGKGPHGWTVSCGGRYEDRLRDDEALWCVVALMTHTQGKGYTALRTPEEHAAWAAKHAARNVATVEATA